MAQDTAPAAHAQSMFLKSLMGFCHLRNWSHLEIFSFSEHVMALSRKAYYYLWSSPERIGLFLKQMFCKTYCDSLIRAGNGPMLGYQPHKGTYLPAGFLSMPPPPRPPRPPHPQAPSPEERLPVAPPSGSWVLKLNILQAWDYCRQRQPARCALGRSVRDNDSEYISFGPTTIYRGPPVHQALFSLLSGTLLHSNCSRSPISEMRKLRPRPDFLGLL